MMVLNRTLLGSCSLARLVVIKNHCLIRVTDKAKILNKITAATLTTGIKQPRAITIKVSKPKARVDEDVCIIVSGLQRCEKITLQTFVFDKNKSFGACGHYIADEKGTVNTYEHQSHGGTFDGFEPMGLFWSMRTCPGLRPGRIIAEDISKPFDIKIHVHSDFMEFDLLPWTKTFDSLASCQFLQEFLPPGVECIPVNEDGVRGVLCLPPGKGPFPAVIDIFGMTPKVYVHRSALLAANGIASFVISYIGGKGYATSWLDLQYSYFLKAFDWLIRQPSIDTNAMGGLASCVGGAYVSLVAWKRPAMKCFVTINSAGYPTSPTQTLEGELVQELDIDMSLMERKDGGVSFKPICQGPEGPILPYWRHGAKALHIEGQDDECVMPGVFKLQHDSRVPEEFMKTIEFVSYPGAGHIIEPPNMPLCNRSFDDIMKFVMLWGGQPKQHAHAQADSWERVVSFLKKNLTC